MLGCGLSHKRSSQNVVNGSAGCAALEASAGNALFDLPSSKMKSTAYDAKSAANARRGSPSGHECVKAVPHHHALELLHRALEVVAPEGASVVLPHLVERPKQTPATRG
jgi:hypothetical protein